MQYADSNTFKYFKDSKPLISLIVPVYNAEGYLSECLHSIASQSFDNFEAIIIDDGSTDSSISIIESICRKDNRFKLYNITHGGVSKARNFGIDIAKGELIGFADADDCLHPQALERMITAIAATDSQVCVATMIKGRDCKAWKTAERKPIVMDYTTAMQNALYQKITLNSPCGMLIKRQLLGDNIRFKEGIRYEDLDAFYRFYEQADKIIYLPEKLYFYRQVSNSFIHQWSDARLDALDVTDEIVNYMNRNHPSLLQAAKDRRFSAHFNLLLLMLRLKIDNPIQIYRCLQVIKQSRIDTIISPHVRLKNKLGALASFGGKPILTLLSKLCN